MTLIEYEKNLSWIVRTLNNIYKCLRFHERPKHSENCEYVILLTKFRKYAL